MRCIRCLNGVELPDMTPEGRREGKKRALVVKVDEKTRQFLEEFESTVGRSDVSISAPYRAPLMFRTKSLPTRRVVNLSLTLSRCSRTPTPLRPKTSAPSEVDPRSMSSSLPIYRI
jgi:hypothetical protein